MKQRSLTALTIIFSLCLLLFACRKEIGNFIHDRKNVSANILESAKIWYLQHVDTTAPKIKKYGPLPAYWKDAWTTKNADSNTILIVPAEGYYINNKNFTFKRFLVFDVTIHGTTNGKIIELVGKNYNTEANFDFLTKNYSKNMIPGFNGSILQYDVSYRPIRNVVYENGKKNKFKRTSFAILKNKQVNRTQKMYDDCGLVWPTYYGEPLGIGPDCTIVWQAFYTYDPITGCLYSVDEYYLYSYCPDGDGGQGGGGSGSGNGSGSGSGGGGSYPPGGSPTPLLDQIMYLNDLTQAQKDSVESVLDKMVYYCLGAAIYDYLVDNNKYFEFSVDPNSTSIANYNPADNNIVIKDPSTLGFIPLQEELFHAYQNFTMPGGTLQYAGAPGSANIEFEAKLLRDIMQYVDGIPGGEAVTDPNYLSWIDSITNGGTQYPTSFSSMQSEYYNYLSEFIQDNPSYSNDQIDPTMEPTALFSLVSSSGCPK